LEGFRGSLRVVGEWATRRRRSEKASDQQLQKVPSARTIARLMTSARDHMSKADTVTIHAVLDALSPFGIKHLDMPMTPPRVWSAIHNARAGAGQ
jgi:hypothetical protein